MKKLAFIFLFLSGAAHAQLAMDADKTVKAMQEFIKTYNNAPSVADIPFVKNSKGCYWSVFETKDGSVRTLQLVDKDGKQVCTSKK